MHLLLSCTDEFQILCEGCLVNTSPCPGRVAARVGDEVGADKGQEEREGALGRPRKRDLSPFCAHR